MSEAGQGRVSTGVEAIDQIMCGGLVRNRAYLVRGGPGTGKTTLGLHFLTSGARAGERTLYITLGEPTDKIKESARTLGFDLTGVEFLDVSPSPELFSEAKTYDIFSPAEVEREPLSQAIVERLDGIKPDRVFIDPMSQLRYFTPDTFQFRRQVASFLHLLLQRDATVLFTSECTEADPDDYLQVVSDGVLQLDSTIAEGRTFSVIKVRGSDFKPGRHAVRLTERGMLVFPRLIPEDYRKPFNPEKISSGIPQFDELLHGGIERGTVTIITGPAGVGKTTIGLQFMKEAAGRGERSVIFSFEEEQEIMLQRAQNLNIPAKTMIDRGTLSIKRVEPLGLSPDEFASHVREEVENRHASLVMIDSIAGYRLSLRGEDLVAHMHVLCKYLQNMGVAVLLINETEAVSGEFRVTDFRISYLADNVLFLRYMERHERGVELRKALGVLKKRMSDFDRSICELEFTRYGLHVGKPLVGVNSILSALPIWTPRPEEKDTRDRG